MQDTLFSDWANMNALNHACCGIDLSSTFHCAFLPPYLVDPIDETTEGRGKIFNFDCDTTGLEALADCLEHYGVEQVVMEATGNFWFGVYEILNRRGLKVCVANPLHARNIAGRKTDEADAEWLCRLHTFGLLRSSFIPEQEAWELRALMRQRDNAIKDRSTYVLRIQKELDAMNVKLHKVISDTMGGAGMAIVRHIAGGVPAADTDWCSFRTPNLRSNEEDFERALKGSYTGYGCFLLSQHLEMYDKLTAQIESLDRYAERILFATTQGLTDEQLENLPQDEFLRPLRGKRGQLLKRTTSKNAPLYDQASYLKEIIGVDVTKIPGMGAQTVLNIISETGTDLGSQFASAAHFASWLQLSPNQKFSGGKQLGHKRVTNANRVHQLFRDCSYSLQNSKTYFGQFYRSLKMRSNGKNANKAVAHKLCVIFYNMVTRQQEYDESKVVPKANTEERKLRKLIAQARKMGLQLTPAEPLA